MHCGLCLCLQLQGFYFKISCRSDFNHRYRKSLNRLLKVCYVPKVVVITVFIAFFSFFAAAINSTNKANKAAGICRLAVYLVRCLWIATEKFLSAEIIQVTDVCLKFHQGAKNWLLKFAV
jgi:hypothetical protein